MLRRFLKSVYESLPIVRELAQLREIHYKLRDLGTKMDSQMIWNHVDGVQRFRDIELIRFLDFTIRDHPRYGDPLRLFRHEQAICSQNGQDGVIREIFRRIGTADRTFVEVGVGDGMENNTVFLLAQGWKGYWIDGDPRFVETLEATRDADEGYLKWLVSMITRENAASLFERLGIPREFELLSLDIDQNTYYIWEALRDYRPRAITIEYNAALPSDLDWKVRYVPDRVWDKSHNFGASLKAMENLGRERGYSLVGCDFTGLDAFFVRDDLVGDRFAAPFTSENHYEPPRYVYTNRRGHKLGILDRIRPAGSASASGDARPPTAAGA